MDTLTLADIAATYRSILSLANGDVKQARENFETWFRRYEQSQQVSGNVEKQQQERTP